MRVTAHLIRQLAGLLGLGMMMTLRCNAAWQLMIFLKSTRRRVISTQATGHGSLQYWSLASLSSSSLRTATITRAKLARAYANAGQPDGACRVAWETLDAIEQVGSLSARNELRRALPVLNQWHGRSDVQDITHRLET